MKKTFALIIILMLTAVLLPGCKKEPSPPDKVVTKFYDWFVSYKGNGLLSGDYKNQEALTDGFISQIERELTESRGAIESNPLTCATDVLTGFEIETTENAGEILLTEQFEGGASRMIKISLEQDMEGFWKISGVNCIEMVK